jgi:pyrophosphatase PpaX
MQLKGIIFDLDGTLTDTLPLCVQAFRHVFDTLLHRHYTDQDIIAMFGVSEEGMIRALMPDDWQRGVAAYLAEYERLHDHSAQVFPGIEDALRLLQHRGTRMAVVTGKGAGSAAITLQRLGLAPYFPLVETGSPDGPIKPIGIRTVLAQWRMAACDVAYVGDAPYDMRASADVGVLPVGAAWADTATVTLGNDPPPAALFTSVAHFRQWLEVSYPPGTGTEAR